MLLDSYMFEKKPSFSDEFSLYCRIEGLDSAYIKSNSEASDDTRIGSELKRKNKNTGKYMRTLKSLFSH